MSLLFPDRCNFCGKLIASSKILICDDCLKTLPIIKGDRCELCGREANCCYCKQGEFSFEKNISLMRYEGPAQAIVKRMKFGGLPQLTYFMGDELALLIKKEYADIKFDFVTYVPMHWLKETRRNYNQAKMIAERVACKLDLPIKKTMTKKFSLKSQKQLNKDQRLKEVRGKFSSRGDFTGKTVLLIDDVLTVGATLSECTRVLKKSGAEYVYTATFAITYKK